MKKSMNALSAAVAAAKSRSGDGVAWLSPREGAKAGGKRHRRPGLAQPGALRVRTAGGEDVRWLHSREEASGSRASRMVGKAGRLTAILGAGCLLSGLVPEAARAPIGRAYAAVDPLVLHHTLPLALSPVDPEPFTHLALRGLGELEPAEGESSATVPDEIVRFGARAVPRRLVATILKAALATDVDPVYLMALADKESSFDTAARPSTSSAEGLFQFIDSTWLETVRAFGAKHGLGDSAAAIEWVDGRATVADSRLRARILELRRDPYLAAVMAAEMLKRDRADIAGRVGRDLTRTELYLAHFLGPQDAARFIALRDRAHKQNAARVFKAAARANRSIFFARKGRRTRGLAVADVYDRLDQMIDSRAARFQNVMAFAADARL